MKLPLLFVLLSERSGTEWTFIRVITNISNEQQLFVHFFLSLKKGIHWNQSQTTAFKNYFALLTLRNLAELWNILEFLSWSSLIYLEFVWLSDGLPGRHRKRKNYFLFITCGAWSVIFLYGLLWLVCVFVFNKALNKVYTASSSFVCFFTLLFEYVNYM